MLDGRYERLATQIQRRINELEAERGEAEDARERATTSLEEIRSGTTWSQRSWFFSWVRNDREAYDRMRPLRAEIRHLTHTIAERETQLRTKDAEIGQVVHDWLAKHHRGYRDLLARQEKTRAARSRCTQLRKAADVAHRRIVLARSSARSDLRDDAARAAANRDAAEVSQQVNAVGKVLAQASHDLRAYGSLHAHVRKLNGSFSGHNADYSARVHELTAADRQFTSLGRDLTTIIGAIDEEEMTIEGQLLDIFAEARAHFT